MSPFCEVCEKPFVDRLHGDHVADCIICGNECCANCIDEHRICKECSTSTSTDGKTLQRNTSMKKKVYYGHCIAIYNTPQEKRDIETLERLGFEVVNPNTPEVAAGYEAYKKTPGAINSPMYYFQRFAKECDCMAFRALPDGSIPAGIAEEVGFFNDEDKPVFELPCNWYRRVLTVTQTKGYLTEVGQR